MKSYNTQNQRKSNRRVTTRVDTKKMIQLKHFASSSNTKSNTMTVNYIENVQYNA